MPLFLLILLKRSIIAPITSRLASKFIIQQKTSTTVSVTTTITLVEAFLLMEKSMDCLFIPQPNTFLTAIFKIFTPLSMAATSKCISG
jgi:hypothetical protein